MAVTKSKKSGNGSRAKHGTCIPKGDDLLPGVDIKLLRSMHVGMSVRKDVDKEVPILKATIKWRKGLGVSEIVRHLTLPRSTVRDWLIRLRDRGLKGIYDKLAPNHKPLLTGVTLIVIGVWLSHSPQAYGFESTLSQTSILRKMMLDRLGTDVKPRTIRNTLYRMGLVASGNYIALRPDRTGLNAPPVKPRRGTCENKIRWNYTTTPASG